MWLRDISRTLPPTTQLDGFDISLKQAEPLAWFPPNVTLRNWDAFSDVPADLVGKYDVVHLRLFVFVVPSEAGPKPLLQNLMKLLSMPLSVLLEIPCPVINVTVTLEDTWKWRSEICTGCIDLTLTPLPNHRARWLHPMGRARRPKPHSNKNESLEPQRRGRKTSRYVQSSRRQFASDLD